MRSLALPITASACSWASLMPVSGWRSTSVSRFTTKYPDVAFRDHEPRQHALGVLLALSPRRLAGQRHDQQFVVAPIRAAHQPPAPGMDARFLPAPTKQARPLSCGFGHRRQICLNVKACEYWMRQFSWWGSPCTGQKHWRWPLFLFSDLRNRSRTNLSYPRWRGCSKSGTLTWRATGADSGSVRTIVVYSLPTDGLTLLSLRDQLAGTASLNWSERVPIQLASGRAWPFRATV